MLNLEKLIKNPENEIIEFKRDLSGKKGLLKDICAFANSNGGYIILGIEDETRKIIGIKQEELFELEEKVTNIISDNFDNRPPYVAKTLNYKGSIILYLEVYPGQLVPYFIKNEGKDNGTYVRIGSSSRPASIEELSELERRRLNIHFDETEVFQANKNNLDYGLIEYHLNKIAHKKDILPQAPSERFLEQLKILKKSGNKMIPTVGGILLFGYRDKIEEYFPYAKIKCARFKGNTSIEYMDKKEISGTLEKQIEEAIRFYEFNEQKIVKIEGLYRDEKYVLPSLMIREAVINAVIHRNYNISGSDIKLNIFDDFIEIISPGRLPFGITKNDLGKGLSEVRNKVIARIFLELGLIEQWGQGIKKIIELAKERDLKEPIFEELSNFFKVTLFKTSKISPVEKKLSHLKFNNYSVNDIRKIIAYVEGNGSIVSSECQRLIGINFYQALYILDRLVEAQILKPTGKGKGRKYLIAD